MCLLLPERVLSLPFTWVKPDSLIPGELFQDDDGSRWRVRWRCKDNPTPIIDGYFCGAPQHVYLMERITGSEKGEIRRKVLTAICNAKLVGGCRYELARRRAHPDMRYITYEAFYKHWEKQVA